MDLRSSSDHPLRLLAGLFVAGLVIRLTLVSLPIGLLLEKLLVDDAFYYLVLARNVAAGEGMVFNTGVPTNGFHPLYAAMLVPLFKFLPGLNAPVRGALVIGSLFSTATMVPMYLLGVELRSRLAGIVAAGCWVLNPFVLFVSLVGVEVPVEIFFVATLTWYVVSREGDMIDMSQREWIVTGVLLALAFLSRMDMVFLSIAIFGTVAVRGLHRSHDLSALITSLRNPVQGGLVATALVTPWLALSVITVGRITPISGEVLRWEISQYPARYGTYLDAVLLAVMRAGNHVWFYFMFYHPTTYLENAVVDAIAFVVLLLLVGVIYRSGWLEGLFSRLDFLAVTGVLYYSYYFFYQTDMRMWYGLFTAFLLTVIVAVAADALYRSRSHFDRREVITVVTVGILLLFTFSGAVHYQSGSAPQERTKWVAANYINEHIPDGATVASFNTGVYQYYTPQNEVLNLDGLMNPEAYEARRSNNLSGYLCQKSVRYVIDPLRDIHHLTRSGVHLSEIRTFGDVYHLYRVTRIEGCS